MIKKTLYFGSPAYLFCKDSQLVIDFKDEQIEMNFYAFPIDNDDENENDIDKKYKERYEPRFQVINPKIPIEDIGVLILDHYGVSVSSFLLSSLIENNVAVITCNSHHIPNGLLLNLDGNSVQSEKFRSQVNASLPLKKQLWAQTVSAKILNQAELLKSQDIPVTNMLKWADSVKSGDPVNLEARAAAYYWKSLFSSSEDGLIDFYRSRTGPYPNNLLNYGYAILRAIVARSLVAAGLLPTLGIHHHNKYNAYCLADDIMEPFRPFVDMLVCKISNNGKEFLELTPNVKKQLLEISAIDLFFEASDGMEKSPLMVGLHRTASSLSKCFEGTLRKINYPKFLYLIKSSDELVN